jgi:hypothetical protein
MHGFGIDSCSFCDLRPFGFHPYKTANFKAAEHAKLVFQNGSFGTASMNNYKREEKSTAKAKKEGKIRTIQVKVRVVRG